MKIELEGTAFPIEFEYIETFERKYGLKLPDDYRDFLFNNNGGTPKQSKFITKNRKIVSHFKYIMPLTKEANNDDIKHNLEYSYIRFVIMKKMPDWVLPFAETPTENILCMSLKEDDYGAVYFWDRELELVHKQPREECYHIIADNFADFINSLRERDANL